MRRQNTSFLNVGSLLVVDSGRWAILAQNWKSSEEILQRLSQGSSFRLYPYSTVVAMVGSRWPLREHRKSQNGSNRARHHVGLGPCGIQAKKKKASWFERTEFIISFETDFDIHSCYSD